MLRPIALFATVLLSALSAAPAVADIEVTFRESAPKDRFTIRNLSACAAGPMEVLIDLAGSAAGLIFDTTPEGAGFNVSQPFEVVAGGAAIEALSVPTDGDTAITVRFTGLGAGEMAAFTVDVDDNQAAGPLARTMIDGSEIAGARVRVALGGGTPREAAFTAAGIARVPAEACVS